MQGYIKDILLMNDIKPPQSSENISKHQNPTNEEKLIKTFLTVWLRNQPDII